ncbi:MAG: hypothetical protein KC708_00415 [Anaerolineae bacterium]|nr:hypothetical protein [Anaerolineae bacterium]
MLDVLATGYPSFDTIFPVSRSAAVGETALIQALPDDGQISFGGCGANVAVGLSRLGFRTGLAMILGNDALGNSYCDYLGQQNIDQSNVICMPGEQSSHSYLFRNPDGEYQNFFFAGAADAWNGDLTLHGLEQVRYGLVTVGPLHYNRQFVEQCASANVPIIWQMKPDIQAYPPESLSLFLQASEIILMNRFEADLLLTATGARSLSDLLRSKTQVIVLTRGADGVTVYADGEQVAVPAIQTHVVDTTGAGDGFTSGFIAGVLRGRDHETSARLGAAVASFVVEKIGCQTNLPTWEDVLKRYEENFGSL